MKQTKIPGRNKYESILRISPEQRTKEDNEQLALFEKHNELRIPKTDNLINYMKKVSGKSDTPSQEETDMKLSEAWDKFIYTAKMMVDNQIGFHIDGENKEVIHFLFKYFTNQRLPKGVTKNNESLDKGILLSGNFGSGKTTLFEIFRQLQFRIYFREVMSYQIVSEFEQHGEKEIVKWFKGNLFIDEVGAEQMAVRWGKKEEVLKRIFETRYVEYMRKKTKTFITTNLTIPQLTERYGGRFESRIPEMFNILYLGSKKDSRDFRKLL